MKNEKNNTINNKTMKQKHFLRITMTRFLMVMLLMLFAGNINAQEKEKIEYTDPHTGLIYNIERDKKYIETFVPGIGSTNYIRCSYIYKKCTVIGLDPDYVNESLYIPKRLMVRMISQELWNGEEPYDDYEFEVAMNFSITNPYVKSIRTDIDSITRCILDCRNLENLVLPDNLYWCLDLHIKNGDNLKEIRFGDGSFSKIKRFSRFVIESDNLESLVIPEGMKAFGPYFNSSGYKREFDYRKSSDAIGVSLNCPAIKTITIPKTLKYTNRYIEAYTGLSVGPGCTSFFSQSTTLENIIFKDDVTSIPKDMFNFCFWLKELNFPNNLERIEKSSFCGCLYLDTLRIPKTVNYIGESAFLNCSGLTDIYVYWEDPIEANDNVFENFRYFGTRDYINGISFPRESEPDIYSTATLHIEDDNPYDWRSPQRYKYKRTSPWKNFFKIVGPTPTRPHTYAHSINMTISANGDGKVLYQHWKTQDGSNTVSASNPLAGTTQEIRNGSHTFKVMADALPIEEELTITPDKGASIVSVTVDGIDLTSEVTAEGLLTIRNINSNTDIVVVFSEDENPSDAVTLTANSYSRAYGEANPTFGYTVTEGTITSGTPTISCDATATSPVGTYDIVIAKGTVSNNTVSLVKGTLTITKAPLTVSAGNYTKVEGEDNPVFTPTYSGFKNGETAAVLTKQPTITTTATKTSTAGTYPVTVSGAEAQNYSFNYQNGTLTVTSQSVVQKDNIQFADAKVKAICVANWDTDHDGELSKQEAAAVTSIGTVFKNNEEITSFDELEFFTGLTSIPNNTFYNCAKLASVVIPANVTDLGTTHPFLRCIALRSVKVADDNATYDSRNNCNAIIETATNKLIYGTVGTAIPSTVKEIGPTAFALCSTMTEITLPEGLQKIDQQAFYGCTGLKSVTIPASVTMIEKEAFTQCYSIQAIMVAAGNTVYDSRNGCNAIIETATNTLIVGCRRTDVPATVTSIGEAAFASQSNLTQITLPEGLVSIGKNAFWDCKELRLVSIPSTVTAIGQFAFENCENLTDVHSYIEEPFAINNNVFTTYETTTLYVPYGTAALYRQTDGWKNFQSIVEMDPPMTAEAGEVVDLGLAVKWADRNLGATDMTSTGTYFAWGDTEARTSYNEADYVFNGGNFPRNIIGTEYDAARQLWGGEWRMPTYEEVQELIDACTWTYTTRNGVNGYLVESLVNDHYIFLPTPGYKEGTTINSSSTYYWTGSPSVNNLSKAMSLTGTGKNVEDIRQYLGALIRPVYNIVVPSSIEMLTVKDVTVTSAGVDVTLSGDLNDVDLLGLTYGKSAEELTISDKNDANHKVTSEISDRPFFYFTGLDANTTYYVRAYMKKTDGSYVESETISFKTLMDMSDFVSLIAKSYTREYGEENPEFEYEVTEGTALGTPTLSCDATKWSPVGEYVIAINTSTMSNSVVETTTGTLTIVPKGIATATLTVADSCAYTGQPIWPDVTVQLDGRVLTEGTDYSLTFTNNFMPGIASLTIMGVDNYTGTVTKTFVIFAPTAIGDVDADATKFDVYDMSGRKIRRHVTNIEGLPKGVYIIGGRKRAVK